MVINSEGCTDTSLHGKELLESDIPALSNLLHSQTVQELHSIASNVSVRLTGSVRKNNIVSRLMAWLRLQ